MNSIETIKTIESSIDCNLMDTKNIAKLIESFTELSSLQKAWKHFCHCKSIFDVSDHNDIKILDNLINYSDMDIKVDTIFENGTKPIDFIVFLGCYINVWMTDDNEKSEEYKALLLALAKAYIAAIDFKFFNASLLMSTTLEMEMFCEFVNSDLLSAESSTDGFDPDNNDHYFHARKNGLKISLARLCIIKALYQDVEDVHGEPLIMVELKELFEGVYVNQIPQEVYKRIWQRAIDFDLDMAYY